MLLPVLIPFSEEQLPCLKFKMHVWYLKRKDSFCPSAASLVIRRNGNSSASTGIRLSRCWCHNWLPVTEMWERPAAGPGRLSLPPPFKGFDSKCDSQLLSVFPPVDMHLKRCAKQKNVYFSFGGYECSTYFSNKIPQNTVLCDEVFFHTELFSQGQTLFPMKFRGDSQLIAVGSGYCI